MIFFVLFLSVRGGDLLWNQSILYILSSRCLFDMQVEMTGMWLDILELKREAQVRHIHLVVVNVFLRISKIIQEMNV